MLISLILIWIASVVVASTAHCSFFFLLLQVVDGDGGKESGRGRVLPVAIHVPLLPAHQSG